MSAIPLVGRLVELEALRRALHRLEDRGGGVVAIEGEPGIGKSRLVAEVLDMASGRGWETLDGTCSELQVDVPFAPLAEALRLDSTQTDADRAAAQRLLHAERSAGLSEAEHRAALAHALTESITRACDRGPTVLAVDDLQWADPATLLVLERLVRRSSHLSLLLVLAMRPYRKSTRLESLVACLHELGHEHLLLGPLEDHDVRTLVEALLGGRAGEGVSTAARGAGGNPFFVVEVIAILEQEGSLERADGVVDAPPAKTMRSLHMATQRRLSFLPRRCVELLRVASMLGSEFDVRELSVVTDRPAVELLPLLSEAIDANVLTEAGDRLAFRHDLVREALYDNEPVSLRQALHFEAGVKLGAAGYPAARVAAHLLRGPDLPGRAAAATLRSVAHECVYHDPPTAVALLERALASADDRSRVDVKAELAHALIWAGRWLEGEQLARELAETERQPDRSREVLVTLVSSGAFRGTVSRSVVREIEAVARAPDLDPNVAARVMTAAAQAAFIDGDLDRAEALAEEAEEAARSAGDRVSRCDALALTAAVRWHQGRAAEGATTAEQAVALADTLPPSLGGDAQMPYVVLAMNLALGGRHAEAFPAFQTAMERAEEANNVFVLGQLHQALGVSQFYAGVLDAAEGSFEAALSLWDEVDSSPWRAIQDAWLGRIAIHRGDVTAARRHLSAAESQLQPGSAWKPANNVAVAALTRALLHETEGDTAAAFQALDSARRMVRASGARYFNLRIGPEVVRLAVSVGDRQVAEEMALACEEVAESVDTPTARGQALRCRGLLGGQPEVLLEAVAAHRAGPFRIELAGAAEEAATAIASSGETRDVVAVLREALEIWESAGATYDAARVLARLRDAGAPRGKRGPRQRPEDGWDALTDSESRVVDLVGEGLTYREIGERLFISRRTVETHVARAFRKLGVRSRAELAAVLIERGGDAA
jgi:DNA-binding CsgD family transcriptional regulator